MKTVYPENNTNASRRRRGGRSRSNMVERIMRKHIREREEELELDKSNFGNLSPAEERAR